MGRGTDARIDAMSGTVALGLYDEYYTARTQLLELLERGPDGAPERPREAREERPQPAAADPSSSGSTSVPAAPSQRWARP